MNQLFYLSVVIPAYNEEKRIGPSLDQMISFLKRQSYAWEIIVVDDGSRDKTSQICAEKLKNFHHQIIRHEKNTGKGAAVRNGMLKAQADFLLFSDADLSTPIEEVGKLIHKLQDGCDLAIGSRALPGSQVEVSQNIIRKTMGKTFNFIARMFAFHSIHDSQCGFKCFKRGVAADLFQRQKLDGFSFDAEIIYLAQKQGYRISEVPVIWRNSPQSRVRMVQDSLGMLQDLLKIYWIHRHDKK